jgi:hypothetical protein
MGTKTGIVMKIFISCKHSDMLDMQIEDEDGNLILEHQGYGPNIGSLSGGDYLSLVIDNDTGKIIDWKPITQDEIENFDE